MGISNDRKRVLAIKRKETIFAKNRDLSSEEARELRNKISHEVASKVQKDKKSTIFSPSQRMSYFSAIANFVCAEVKEYDAAIEAASSDTSTLINKYRDITA